MNGTSQSNQNSLLIDETSFLGATKTYVFETVKHSQDKRFTYGSNK